MARSLNWTVHISVLFCLDIKFVIAGINVFVLDALIAGIWVFVRLCRWAGRENTGKRTLAVSAIMFVGLLAAPVLLFGLGMYGGWYEYAEGTEPQTRRAFVVEYRRNMLQKGTAKVYERFGPLLFPCGVPEYRGPLNFDELDSEYAYVCINEEQQAITVALFIYGPRFHIPMKLPEGTAKTPERVLIEQLVDDDHDAFLVSTGGRLATVEDLFDGQMVVVYRKEWDLTTIKEGTPLVDWSWYDLDYHGEAY